MILVKKIGNIVFEYLAHKSWINFIYWKYRHLYNSTWPNAYIKTLGHPHREILQEKIKEYGICERVLELGCASGPNLFLLSEWSKKTELYGLDISSAAIACAKKHFKNLGIKKACFEVSNLSSFEKYPNDYFDLVIADAVLIYFDGKRIVDLTKEMHRIAKKGVVLVEYDDETLDGSGKLIERYWVRDYRKLFASYNAVVTKQKITEDIWGGSWSKLGAFISVKFNKGLT